MTHNYYLGILGLHEGATKAEIKAAYRSLSKQYHPDISKYEDAKERFIQIHEAYKFLTTVGPRPQTIKPSQSDYDYDPEAEAYRQYRAKARAYAQQRTRDAIREKNELIKYLLKFFNVGTVAMLLFNILLEVDTYLPLQTDDYQVVNRQVAPERGKSYGYYDVVHFPDFHMKFDKGDVKYMRKHQVATVHRSTIFSLPVTMDYRSTQGDIIHLKQRGSMMGFFNFLIKIILLGALLYHFVFMTLDTKLSMAIFLTFLYFFELSIFFS
ncbi:DnaJ domain-containing protein [Gilvimarinus agarilyticus]|uniref:DnaJ domain-containing protein n=1 Tax=Reichenbachiella agariperforans TaxID=156994 RepID=UPI001C093AA9|nr:DnaJ domain-containing protein [Gilvimarinus agarilyticus]MBU2912998.1 DnaJ domain-containing protein [Reichenbachiella agariperforans]